jgi:hypothetical protein
MSRGSAAAGGPQAAKIYSPTVSVPPPARARGGNQLVIVEPQARRIVAIVPNVG